MKFYTYKYKILSTIIFASINILLNTVAASAALNNSSSNTNTNTNTNTSTSTNIISNSVISDKNKLDIGFNKLNNTWNFTTDFDIKLYTSFGEFFLQNSYLGTSIEQIKHSFRDSENFKMLYQISIFENIFLQSEVCATLFSDSRTTGINNLQRVSGVAGVKLLDSRIGELSLLLGAENNKQITTIANGLLAKINGTTKDYNLNEYKINAKLNSEFLFLDDNRELADLEFSSYLFRHINNDNNLLNFEVRYKLMGRDFLQVSPDSTKINNVESYKENRFSGVMQSRYGFNKNIIANIYASIENISINRFFKNSIVENKNSLIDRHYNELKLDIKSSFDILFKDLFQNIAIQISYRGEENYIKQRHQNLDNDLVILQNSEVLKDNLSTTYRLFYKNILNISFSDTLFTDIMYSKLEYDTPSKNNNDDRDELYLTASLEYHRRFSDILLFTSKLNTTQNHLVFLKSERSGQNNWNKILSLQFGVIFENKYIKYAPYFEVLANYTIYDFDLVQPEAGKNTVKSYSFRQISYRDTLSIELSPKYTIINKSIVRYYEQGKLYWNSFSELPQQANFEASLAPALVNNIFINNTNSINKSIKLSLGVRMFYLTYGQISSENKIISPNEIYTISPEISTIFFYNKIKLNCYGWLEYKHINNKYVGFQPNLFLQTSFTF